LMQTLMETLQPHELLGSGQRDIFPSVTPALLRATVLWLVLPLGLAFWTCWLHLDTLSFYPQKKWIFTLSHSCILNKTQFHSIWSDFTHHLMNPQTIFPLSLSPPNFICSISLHHLW
jgi:hypothetical protein